MVEASAGSARSAVTSLTMTAPSSTARRATSAFDVSTETGTPRSCSSAGTTRRSSSSSETPSEPGRVDSPPTSTIAAPSASSRSAWADADSGSASRPSSEKESGVTFTTPMTLGRGSSVSTRTAVITVASYAERRGRSGAPVVEQPDYAGRVNRLPLRVGRGPARGNRSRVRPRPREAAAASSRPGWGTGVAAARRAAYARARAAPR